MSIIRVENLKKRIKGKSHFRRSFFAVERGDCLALIGPNGSWENNLDELSSGRYESDVWDH